MTERFRRAPGRGSRTPEAHYFEFLVQVHSGPFSEAALCSRDGAQSVTPTGANAAALVDSVSAGVGAEGPEPFHRGLRDNCRPHEAT